MAPAPHHPSTSPRSIPPSGSHRHVLNRRSLLLGTGTVGLAAAGAVAGRLVERGGGAPATGTAGSPAVRPASPAPPAETSSRVAAAASPRPSSSRGFASTPIKAQVPEGMALVTSPRLPLFGVGPDDPARLLRGEVADWRAVGSAVAMPVAPLVLAGEVLPGAAPVATFPDYEALVAGLDERRGGVALVPIEAVDFRVNVLAVGGHDPLRHGDVGGEPAIRIGVVGDIVPGRNVHLHMVEYGDFTRPFHKVAPHLAGYDLTFANLEGNLSDSLPQTVEADPNTFTFVSSPAMTEGFKLAGIDAFTLANNHSVWNEDEWGWGVQGLLDTIEALEAADLPYFGAGRNLDEARRPWTTTIKGRTIALLGIDGVTANYEVEPGRETGVVQFDAGAGAETPGTSPYDSALFLADIAAAAEQADIVIPYFHMGAEYVAVPPRWAVNGARAAIDAGATLVITLHPHVIQGMEIYNDRPIVYSPGNFVFDQMFGVEVRSGFILDLTLRGDRVVGLRCHGVEIEEFHQPRPMTAGEQAALMDRFWASTDRLASGG